MRLNGREWAYGDRDGLRTTAEPPPRHANISEQSDPGIGLTKMRSELSIRFERTPIVFAPSVERRKQVTGLLLANGQARAPALRFDRDPPLPIKSKGMPTRDMSQPAMRVFEIRRLGAKRGNHRGHSWKSHTPLRQRSDEHVCHDSAPCSELAALKARTPSRHFFETVQGMVHAFSQAIARS